MRHHIGGIDAGKRLIVAVLEQRRRAYCQRAIHHIEQRIEVEHQPRRQICRKEAFEYLLVGGVAQGYWIEVVGAHKLIEDVGAQHHGARNLHTHAIEIVELRILLDDAVDKRQASALAAQRALPDAGKVAVMVEAVALEHCHHAAVLHLAILHNKVEYQLAHRPVFFNMLVAVHLHHLGNGEQRTRIQPTRNIVVVGVVV